MAFLPGTNMETVSSTVIQTIETCKLRVSKLLLRIRYTKGSETSITLKFSGYIDQEPGDDGAVEYKITELVNSAFSEVSSTITNSMNTILLLDIPSRLTKLRITILYNGNTSAVGETVVDTTYSTAYSMV
jgi:hypothetical protein